MSANIIHEREQDDSDIERYSKRARLDVDGGSPIQVDGPVWDSILPPSHALLGIPVPVAKEGSALNFHEADVGISEYIGRGEAKVEGIIKQRFTDFLVYEVDQDGNVIHLKTLGKPESPKKEKEVEETHVAKVDEQQSEEQVGKKAPTKEEPWPEHFNASLSAFLDEEKIEQLKSIYLEGPEPPRVSDNGWGGRPIASKDTRTAFHKAIRELFNGKLDTETDMTAPSSADEGSRIVVKWARKGGGRGGGRARAPRGTYPPYIHFTLQKTNRDTQDALGHIARSLHVNTKDLSVAGTKDKRGVTVQRVSLNRNNKTVEEVWKLANNIGQRRTIEDAMTQRGERGIRVADLNYRKAGLELGMLKGNAFVITLRNVKVSSMEVLDEAMNTIKNKGFINYYGMQRFGTASVPTHSIGLALLKSEWQKAADMILQKRYGEHPDVEAARDAWLVEKDLDKALSLFPRRVVAERCILESFKKQKGDTRNVMGALSTIPRNLRLMYVHAYQSYVWNAIVSERIRDYGSERPVVGDLVFDTSSNKEKEETMDVDGEEETLAVDPETEESAEPSKKNRKPYVAPKIKTLTEEDLDKYTIFDVVMPLPGTDVAYPGGKLGERYREFLRTDGLDPDNFVRKQKDYTLNGSYRKMLHLPKELSWSVLRYTDPDVSLAQSDEDKLLGFDPPAVVEDGKFMALQINLQLGTAAYATMALREITKTDTSSHVQTSLTANAEDQKYRGATNDTSTVVVVSEEGATGEAAA
ncbi:pseudouridine synthase [Agrocybe pediades]|nr:pseudouridine synthase [Agrocybe pediades]